MRPFPNWAYALETLVYLTVIWALLWWLAQGWMPEAAQEITGLPTYTVADPFDPQAIDLAMPNGRYLIELGYGCEGIGPRMNVLWLAGSGGVGAIQPVGSDQLCNVYISLPTDSTPCAMNADGACDVAAE